jgi:hypothetical protein
MEIFLRKKKIPTLTQYEAFSNKQNPHKKIIQSFESLGLSVAYNVLLALKVSKKTK